MPEHHQTYLRELVYDTLGEDRAEVIFRGKGHAGQIFRRYQRHRMGIDGWTTQAILDDDDAMSNDFVRVMRQQAFNVKSELSSEAEH